MNSLRVFKLIVLLSVPLLGGLYFQQAQKQAGSDKVPFKSFKAPTLSFYQVKAQKEIDLNLDKPITVVNFWATWCAPCRKEFPALLELKRQLKDNDKKVG